MLRSALRAQLRPSSSTYSRTFVSTVLLTKAWENETVNDLRREARRRGLPQQGNKATLVTRLLQDDEKKVLAASPLVSPRVRHASTTEVPGIPSTAPPPSWPKEFMNVKLPNLAKPDPEPQIQIPFVPDLWDSSRVKAESTPRPAEPSTPKMIAVAGSATHHGGGPTHHLVNPEVELASETPSQPGPSGFWRDLAEDLNLPTSLKLPNPVAQAGELFDVAETTGTSAGQGRSYSRTLDKDEKQGLWALLGLLTGSWVAAGYFQVPSVFAEKAEEAAEQAEEKAAGGQ
ncbi:hypothetical protein AcW1_005702 [Taiwanofungus camphoratus]|nr:hypothetical protein AcW2_004465 [Antrodia cinnamomea]KAI0928465.1 hypothetical protein AcW2_004465 [Antrodia cinnamomea]KAI0933075.1 hypothetical protein AcV7_004654 [Antrodia cinnamomea]KAI0950646.1 hypothetical protein AcV7_009044 [Antrodia cinnamomea]KAI0957246.1 hypothetical protein AcW1_005702 [Antrodia cinnamomea]